MNQHPGKDILDRCICLVVRKASRAVAQAYDNSLAPDGVSSGQFTLLAQVKLKPGVTISALARQLCLDRTSLTRNLQRLEELEAIAIAAGEEDLRKRVITLTSGGERLLASAFPSWNAAQHALMDALGRRSWERALKISRALVTRPDSTIRKGGQQSAPHRSPSVREAPGQLTLEQLAVLRGQLCMCTLLRRAARALSKPYDQALRPVRLRISQFHILAAVDAYPRTRTGGFVDVLTLDQTTLTRVLQRLLDLGLIAKEVLEGKRAGYVLTTAGLTELQKGALAWRRAQAGVEKTLTPEFETEALSAMRSVTKAASTLEVSSLPPGY
jgi:DNA-binding MarR family transcriptional regulator